MNSLQDRTYIYSTCKILLTRSQCLIVVRHVLFGALRPKISVYLTHKFVHKMSSHCLTCGPIKADRKTQVMSVSSRMNQFSNLISYFVHFNLLHSPNTITEQWTNVLLDSDSISVSVLAYSCERGCRSDGLVLVCSHCDSDTGSCPLCSHTHGHTCCCLGARTHQYLYV